MLQKLLLIILLLIPISVVLHENGINYHFIGSDYGLRGIQSIVYLI